MFIQEAKNVSQHLRVLPNLALAILLICLVIVATSCDPLIAGLAARPTSTLRPPMVHYATSTLTPTVTFTPTLTQTATQTFTPTPTPTATATYTNTPSATPTPYPTRVVSATLTPLPTFGPLEYLPDTHFWLGRPVPDGYQNYVEPNYRYGTTQGGALRPHHGVDYYNPVNTPVIATASGQVVFSGSDQDQELGLGRGFYGTAVVVKLDQSYYDQPIFTLYGHLDKTVVSVGQRVEQGEQLGAVGGTGVAKGGAHLHLEVRVGYNDYLATRNPEIWMKPFSGWGTLVGRVTDEESRLVPMANITIRSITLDDEEREQLHRYTTTYFHETLNPDDRLGENFAISDMPSGTYAVSVGNGLSTVKKTVLIEADKLSWIEFTDVIPPATWTPTPTSTP